MSQQLILTCQACEGPNPRSLPYSLRKPDRCEHCGNNFRTTFDIAVMDFKLWRKQSRLASAVEAVVNTLLGLVIAFFAQWLIVWAYEIPISHTQNAIIVFWMTILSVARSYAVRRAWNSEFWKYKRPGRSI